LGEQRERSLAPRCLAREKGNRNSEIVPKFDTLFRAQQMAGTMFGRIFRNAVGLWAHMSQICIGTREPNTINTAVL
jgi:hypothetical protein